MNNLTSQSNENELQRKVDKGKNGVVNYVESTKKKKIRDNFSEIIYEQTQFRNKTKKAFSSKSYCEERHSNKHHFSNFHSADALKLIQKNEKDELHRRHSSENFSLSGVDALTGKKNSSSSNTSYSKDTHERKSYEKFFEICSEAKQELSDHVKMLIKQKNESDQWVSNKRMGSEICRRSDEHDYYHCDSCIRKKRKKSKGSKKKSKKSKMGNYEKKEEYQSFNKLKTLYEGAQQATSYYITKMLSSKVHIEKNIVAYDDIMSKHSENILKKWEIFEETAEQDAFESNEIGNDFLGTLCEYFTYFIYSTLLPFRYVISQMIYEPVLFSSVSFNFHLVHAPPQFRFLSTNHFAKSFNPAQHKELFIPFEWKLLIRRDIVCTGVTDGTTWKKQNGMKQNGMKQNGMKQSGMKQSGMKQSGMKQSGIKQSGMKQSGMKQSGMKQSGMKQSGMKQSGMKQSGMKQSGMKLSGL
ncbi:conserved Plasmodium protein, unknown function [Plasmodium ovale curtisi]|uniref:Uncharacterized protein n=1 Tax=Plasmodium ovale curtisi TaxID=864141 RepID=A0A1A8XD80_PLAOA|nr:conserved Plasmodium protein, unknown function [Plasmodium ovale curtisi]